MVLIWLNVSVLNCQDSYDCKLWNRNRRRCLYSALDGGRACAQQQQQAEARTDVHVSPDLRLGRFGPVRTATPNIELVKTPSALDLRPRFLRFLPTRRADADAHGWRWRDLCGSSPCGTVSAPAADTFFCRTLCTRDNGEVQNGAAWGWLFHNFCRQLSAAHKIKKGVSRALQNWDLNEIIIFLQLACKVYLS